MRLRRVFTVAHFGVWQHQVCVLAAVARTRWTPKAMSACSVQGAARVALLHRSCRAAPLLLKSKASEGNHPAYKVDDQRRQAEHPHGLADGVCETHAALCLHKVRTFHLHRVHVCVAN